MTDKVDELLLIHSTTKLCWPPKCIAFRLPWTRLFRLPWTRLSRHAGRLDGSRADCFGYAAPVTASISTCTTPVVPSTVTSCPRLKSHFSSFVELGWWQECGPGSSSAKLR